jgi:hypothetical protein
MSKKFLVGMFSVLVLAVMGHWVLGVSAENTGINPNPAAYLWSVPESFKIPIGDGQQVLVPPYDPLLSWVLKVKFIGINEPYNEVMFIPVGRFDHNDPNTYRFHGEYSTSRGVSQHAGLEVIYNQDGIDKKALFELQTNGEFKECRLYSFNGDVELQFNGKTVKPSKLDPPKPAVQD